ncbi:MAG: hypothetical protein U0935_08725 [Pirellulales bacterium]
MSTDAPPKHEASSDTARQWCEEARKILGRFGIRGEAKQLKQAYQKIHSELSQLEDYLSEEQLEELQQQYVDLAWELKHHEDQYRKFEAKESEAKSQYYRRVGFNDKAKERKWKPAEEEARASKEKAKEDLLQASSKLQLLELRLSTELNQLKGEAKLRQGAIKDKKQLGFIKAGQESETKFEKLIETFQSNYDSETAGLIQQDYDKYHQDHPTDWYDTGTSGDRQRESRKEAIAGLVEKWQQIEEDYKTNKGVYDKAIKGCAKSMAKVEQMLSANSRKQVLNHFYEGQDAALRKNWKLAGERINPQLQETINRLLQDVEDIYQQWQELRSSRYQQLKAKLDQLDDPLFMNMGLTPLAEVVALAEESKDYVTAVSDFTGAENRATEVIMVAETAAVKLKEYNVVFAGALKDVYSLTGDALALAVALPDKIKQELDAFQQAMHVATLEEIQQVIRRHEAIILGYQQQIADCQNPALVQQRTQELAEQKDVRPYIEGLNAAAATAHDAAFIYAGLGADPAGDPALVAGWEGKVEAARKFVASLERVQEKENFTNFDKHTELYHEHIAALEQVKVEADNLRNTAEQQGPALRTELQQKLKSLKSLLSDNRWMTLRKATWYVAAEEERLQITAAATSGCLSLLREKIARVDEMIAIGNKTLEYYIIRETGMDVPDMRYDDLKSRLSGVVKKLNSSDLKKSMPTERDRLLGLVLDAQTELRTGGPGLIDDATHPGWDTRIRDMETELTQLQQRLRELKTLRGQLTEKANQIRASINGPLISQLKSLTGKEVNPDHLPLSSKLSQLEAGFASESIDALKLQLKKVENLAQEVEFTLDDGAELVVQKEEDQRQGKGFALASCGNETFEEIARESERAAKEDQENLDALLELRSRYNDEVSLYKEVRERLKGVPDLDKDELKRIVGVYKEGLAAVKKPAEDWATGYRKVSLARRMAEQLEKDPLASQTTERGRKHLKELNPRWTKGIETLLGTVRGLSGKIGEAAESDPEIGDAKKVTEPFNAVVLDHMSAALEVDAFQQELLVLGADAPSGKVEKEKDLARKRQIREQALAKVRRYLNVVSKDPIFAALMYENNPWSRSGGAVQGLPLVRALNDLDLNIQRAV